MDNLMIAFVVLLVMIFVSRKQSEKANKKLDQEKKAELIDLFSKDRTINFGILITIIVLFFIAIRFSNLNTVIIFASYIFIVLIFMIISAILSYRKLINNDFPESFIRSYLIATLLRFLGLIIFFTIVIN